MALFPNNTLNIYIFLYYIKHNIQNIYIFFKNVTHNYALFYNIRYYTV